MPIGKLSDTSLAEAMEQSIEPNKKGGTEVPPFFE